MKPIKYVWIFTLKNRAHNLEIINSRIALPTKCGLTAAQEIMKRYDDVWWLDYLSNLGEVEE